MKSHVSTGAIGYVELDRPRPGPAAKGKGAVAVRPGPVAYYAGETEEDARAFAAVVNRSYAGLVKREAQRAVPERVSVKSPVIAYPSRFDPTGLVWHRCAAIGDGRKVRAKYLDAAGKCPLCIEDSCKLRRTPVEPLFETQSLQILEKTLPADFTTPADHKPLKVVARAKPQVVKPSVKAQKAPKRAVKPAAPVMAPRVEAHDGGTLLCARCGRSDFRTPKGRDWHLANNPDCAKYRKSERHAYATL